MARMAKRVSRRTVASPDTTTSDCYSGIHFKEIRHEADAKKKKEKELHLHEKEDKEEEISMTELAFTDDKEEYFNSKHNSPTVQRVHPETIIAMPITP
eukprot:2801728-Ditylum_brightwellii.AAC.1